MMPNLFHDLDGIETTDLGVPDDNGFFFTYRAGEFEVSMKCDMDAGSDEVCQNFINFIYACGFSLTSVVESFHQSAVSIDKLEFGGKLLSEQ